MNKELKETIKEKAWKTDKGDKEKRKGEGKERRKESSKENNYTLP